MTIDLNCDMGEREDIAEERLLPLISSANVSCGAHAGTVELLERTLRLARRHGVACGAHPSYPDRAGFGRVSMTLSGAEIEAEVERQVRLLAELASKAGVELGHVKPHGALYNDAARSEEIAAAVAGGVARWSREVVLVGLAGMPVLEVWRRMSFRVAAEAFADRAYEPDGSLRPRSRPGALIVDPAAAAEQALALARRGDIQTLCIHSDTPGAERMLAAVRARLEGKGMRIAPVKVSSLPGNL